MALLCRAFCGSNFSRLMILTVIPLKQAAMAQPQSTQSTAMPPEIIPRPCVQGTDGRPRLASHKTSGAVHQQIEGIESAVGFGIPWLHTALPRGGRYPAAGGKTRPWLWPAFHARGQKSAQPRSGRPAGRPGSGHPAACRSNACISLNGRF